VPIGQSHYYDFWSDPLKPHILDAKMMKEMSEMMIKSGMMIDEKGTKYNDTDLTAEGKVFLEKSKKMGEMGGEMVERGKKLMEMVK